MVSVYVNDKFAWQLPKKLLYDRVPAAKANDPSNAEEDPLNAAADTPAVWKIDNCSDEAFRLLVGWLYNPRCQLKEPVAGKPTINAYLELNHVASKYAIHDLASAVGKTVQSFLSSEDNMSSVSGLYDGMPAKSADRSALSARYAAFIVAKSLDLSTLQSLIKSSELAVDLLIWIVLYNQRAPALDGYEKIHDWMGENFQLWIDAHE